MGCVSASTKPQTVSQQALLNHGLPSETKHLNPDELRIAASSFISKRHGRIRDHYNLGSKLGSGAFGFVRLATHKLTGQRRAVKTIDKEDIVKDMAERVKFFAEVDVLRTTDHPNIVRLFEFFEDEKYYHLVTEYIPGGELFDYIVRSKRLSEPIAAHFMRQLLSAVTYCHANNIVHRDLKPENLLLDREAPDATLKVIDFGTSTVYKNSESMKKRYGTAYYIAPEVLQKDYTEKCDIWSCGVILYILLSGKPPFYGRKDQDILNRVRKGVYSMDGPEWASISTEAKQFIRRMLEFNPRIRISAAEAMRDPWLVKSANTRLDQGASLASIETLQGFRAEQKLQHAVMTYIASQLIGKEESKKLAESFRRLDKDGDGKLSKEELIEVYAAKVGPEQAEQEVIRIMNEVDVNCSGYIDYTEFVMASSKADVLLSKSNLTAAFRAFDIDKNGKISAQELKEVFGGLEGSSIDLCEELIREADLNGDGEIDINEFKEMMIKLIDHTQ